MYFKKSTILHNNMEVYMPHGKNLVSIWNAAFNIDE